MAILFRLLLVILKKTNMLCLEKFFYLFFFKQNRNREFFRMHFVGGWENFLAKFCLRKVFMRAL